jgi:hypothetical protein
MGFFDDLVSNPSLDQFFTMSVAHKTNIFGFALHDHQVVLVYWHIFSNLNFAFFILAGIPYFDAVFL